MAPKTVPEEVDVFTVPHSRMKALVQDYVDMIQSTNFSSNEELGLLLESLCKTFVEFKQHEQIENRFILKKLKHKLKKLSIRNTFVCNCHKDNHMVEMMMLLKDGFNKKTDQDRFNYGLQLKLALDEFTEDFLPHMAEEEAVFQPLLLQYFTYDELRDLKQKVIEKHLEKEAAGGIEKWVLDQERELQETSGSSSSDCEEEARLQLVQEQEEPVHHQTSITELPPEITTDIFSHLDVRDRCQVRQVCQQWNKLAMDPQLWKDLYPVHWAKGDWAPTRSEDVDSDGDSECSGSLSPVDVYSTMDEDADVDESAGTLAAASDYIKQVQKEGRVVNGLINHVLPHIGHGVKKLVMANCYCLTNDQLHQVLQQCPNIEHLDLSQTAISDKGLRSLGKNGRGSKLKHVTLSGCVNITDATLVRLSVALNQPDANQSPSKEQTCVSNNRRPNKCANGEDCLCEMYYRAHGKILQPCNNNPFPSSNSQRINSTRNQMFFPADGNCYEGGVVGPGNERNSIACDGENRVNGPDACGKGTSAVCHSGCAKQTSRSLNASSQIEDCAISAKPPCFRKKCWQTKPTTDNTTHTKVRTHNLQYLNLSGCFQISDLGLRALARCGHFPALGYLDLSGCLLILGSGLRELVEQCPTLTPDCLFYCDNIVDGPYADTASGCRNLQCGSRVCCRSGH